MTQSRETPCTFSTSGVRNPMSNVTGIQSVIFQVKRMYSKKRHIFKHSLHTLGPKEIKSLRLIKYHATKTNGVVAV
jgi:hypothetical protein